MASSSSSSLPSRPYEVFLNFRGEIRKDFVVHLNKALKDVGVHTFMDDEKIQTGEKIEVLFPAIEQSQIAIPILSNDYASNKWCLDELVKILDCRETKGQIVIPIFLNVQPSEVKKQAGIFQEPLNEHEKKFETDMMEQRNALTESENIGSIEERRKKFQTKMANWRKTLTEVTEIKGIECKAEYEDESKLITSVVGRVLSELNITPLNVARYPTGLDSRVEELLFLLNLESTDSKFVGICGMGGIGKTTLANAIYNQIFRSFEGSIFLPDVRAKALQSNGLVTYQEQLLSKILKKEVDKISYVNEGSELIKRRLQGKKVLIILDDVDQSEQLDALASDLSWFGPGSRIIITTRDEQVLKARHIKDEDIYKPKGLDNGQSLLLFSMYAFQKKTPPEDFIDLSKVVVRYADGLPLTLEVLGSYLCTLEEMEWKDTLKKLKEAPDGKVYNKLKISYDGLDQNEKDIFLDIACFFIGEAQIIVKEIWEACTFNPDIGIRRLIRKSLVKINDDGRLWMHDQLRDMGRKIVYEENPTEPGERSRLWSRDDIMDVLKKQKGTSKVQGILPYPGWKKDGECLRIEDLATMSNLRFLLIDGVKLDGNIEHLPSGLRWLRWHYCPLETIPSNFCLEKLSVLDLWYTSHLRQAWNSWSPNKKFENLKILKLRSCNLAKSLDLTGLPQLEILILDDCDELVDLHLSFEQSKRLLHLELTWCSNLEKLPSSISSLHSLQNLILSHSRLKELPESIGDLKSLLELDLKQPQIQNLPNSFGRLTTLKRLSLSGCRSVTKIPDFIGGMMSLVYLNLERMSITELPKLPSSLIELDAGYCSSLKRLPNLSNLKNLRELNITDCFELANIPELEGADSLEVAMAGCFTLTDTPTEAIVLDDFNNFPFSVCEIPPRYEIGVNGIGNGKSLCLAVLFDRDIWYDIIDSKSYDLCEYLYIEAYIHRNGKQIGCFSDLVINDNGIEMINHDIMYIHYFQALDWFGIPLKVKDEIEIREVKYSGIANPKLKCCVVSKEGRKGI